MTARQDSDLQIYRRLLRQARPYWPHIGGILALSLLSMPLALLTPVPLKIVVDSALGGHPLPNALSAIVPDIVSQSSFKVLVFAIVLVLVITMLSYVRSFGSDLLETYTGAKLVLAFRSQLFQHVQNLSFAHHDRKGIMDSVYRIQYDALAIQWIAVQGVIPFLTAGLTVVGMVYVLACIDWQLALVALMVAPVLFGITQIFRQPIRKEWSKVKAVESSTLSGVQEALSALRVVKAFGQEDRERQRFLHSSERSLRGQLRLAFINGGFDGLIWLTIAVGTAAALFIGARHVEVGILTLGNLLLTMSYLGQLYTPLQEVSNKLGDLQGSLESAQRAFQLLDEEPDVVERPSAQSLMRARGKIAFRNVCFAYSEGPQVLHDVSVEVGPGNRVGIMGPSGAGKTTFVSLLMRLYDPTKGVILLDDMDLRDIRLTDLRRQFSLVLQEPLLFSASVAENIGYGRPSATEDEIVAAARLANAHDFVTRLPQKYETSVGERGMALSGGERQRIALARAFLKDAPILILDEPTSSVDVATESSIVAVLEQLMKGRTTFIIAHRLSTLRSCNLRLSLEDGRFSAWSPGSPAEIAGLGGESVSPYPL
jgi:ATP-binding cassette subfamily B protein